MMTNTINDQNLYNTSLRLFWYKQFLKSDMELDDVVVERQRTYYSIDEMHKQFIKNVEFHLSLRTEMFDIIYDQDDIQETSALLNTKTFCDYYKNETQRREPMPFKPN